MIDPTHGNITSLNLNDVLSETKMFFDICKNMNIYPGGVHLDFTANHPCSECLGGLIDIKHEDVLHWYKTNTISSDPRLNLTQSIEYIFEMCRF
jgi:3-deoxy-D-arabino-heptulosonate 7-phosphate (DAHP) synthase class II